jgi:hypothetical protein
VQFTRDFVHQQTGSSHFLLVITETFGCFGTFIQSGIKEIDSLVNVTCVAIELLRSS